MLDTLDYTSDYDHGLERLNSHVKSVVDKLKSLGSGEKSHSHAPTARECTCMAFLN